MSRKMYYMTCGCIMTFANILLIETRFNSIGLLFGLIAMAYIIKAIRTKP